MNPNKKRLSRISPEKAFYELLKTIKRKVWLGVTWLGLAWLARDVPFAYLSNLFEQPEIL